MRLLPGLCEPGSDGNEGVHRIPQSSGNTGTLSSDCFVSYPRHSFGRGLTPLQRNSRFILQPQPTGQYLSTLVGNLMPVHVYVYHIFTHARVGYDTRSIFKQSLTGLNSEFSFSYTSCLTKPEESNLPNYLPIAGGRIIGLIPFPRVLGLCEMQSVFFRIWTRVHFLRR